MIDTTSLRKDLGLSRTEADVMVLLLDMTVAATEDVATVSKDTRALIRRLRAKLDSKGITVHNRRELGYWLDDPVRTSLRVTYDPEFKPLPADLPTE